VEKDQASVATVYSGILIEYLDSLAVLPLVFSLDTLEYDLTSRIRSLVRGGEREVGIIVGDADRELNNDYPLLARALEQSGFRPRPVTAGDEIPGSLGGLIVLGGVEDLDEWALYRIDRYIRSGGKAFFGLDAVGVDPGSALEARPVSDKGLLSMVSSYGAKVKGELVLDRAALTVPFQNGRQVQFLVYPFWIGVQEQNRNKNHPVTANFGGLDLYWASPLELDPPAGVQAEPLFSSTSDAWLMTKDFTANPEAEYLFTREQAGTKGVKILGAALSGVFPSWFEGKPKPVREGSSTELPDMDFPAKPARIIIVGDRDLAGNFTQTSQGEQRNLNFMLQAMDWLGNDDDIISIRSRQSPLGRLDKISDPGRREAAMLFSRALNVFVIPGLVIVFGFFLYWRRSRATAKPANAVLSGSEDAPEAAQSEPAKPEPTSEVSDGN
jgi:ABC-type uncharacterized transport system involved in gliding motility auxiliary subunit